MLLLLSGLSGNTFMLSQSFDRSTLIFFATAFLLLARFVWTGTLTEFKEASSLALDEFVRHSNVHGREVCTICVYLLSSPFS